MPRKPAPARVPPAPAPPALRRFRAGLLRWYARHRRDLPWRRTRDPYHVLVSEIMLQQTQVERVVPKYHEFLGRYPTLAALAAADVADVRRTWYPLGYNVRPLHLHGIAREAVARYGGRLPADDRALRSMKGIGRYTAGAVRAFAYGERAAILDTNVRRVLGRVFHGTDGRRVRTASLWTLAERVLPRRRVYDFNQALMDFGATWCTARTPRCLPCPLRRLCRAYPWAPGEASGRPLVPPLARPAPAGRGRRAGRPVLEVTAAVIRRRGRFLVTRRDPAKHLGGLWEFPGGKRQPGESLEACLVRELGEELGARVRVRERLAVVPWTYPDRSVRLHFFRCELGAGRIAPREGQPHRWVTPAELAALPMPPADAALVARLSGAARAGRRPAGRPARPPPRRPS